MSPRAAAWSLAWCVVIAGVAAARADSQLWVEGGVGVQPTRPLTLDLTAQLRFDQDVSRFSAFLPELTAHYRVKRWFRVGGGYRLEYERNSRSELVLRHRASADARFRLDRGPMRVDYRLMLAEQIRPSSGNQFRAVLRNRVDVSYRDLGQWEPWVGAEVFHMLDDLNKVEYDRTRLTLGMAYSPGSYEIDAFLRAELHADPMEPTFYILGLGYHYEL